MISGAYKEMVDMKIFIGIVVFGLAAISAMLFWGHSRGRVNPGKHDAEKRGAGRMRDNNISASSDDVPTLEDMLSSFRTKALAYAVYHEAIKRGIRKTVKDRIFAKYGYVNLPPSLEEHEAFRKFPRLMSDGEFLALLNRWLLNNGGSSKDDFFSCATEVGKVLVEACSKEAVQIVANAV